MTHLVLALVSILAGTGLGTIIVATGELGARLVTRARRRRGTP